MKCALASWLVRAANRSCPQNRMRVRMLVLKAPQRSGMNAKGARGRETVACGYASEYARRQSF